MAYRNLASRDIASLKLELRDAEENLKTVTKWAEDNQQRLNRELAAAHARNTRNIIEHGAEVTRVKEVLDRKLEYARTMFSLFPPDVIVQRFESGDLDFSIFKDPENVRQLRAAYTILHIATPNAIRSEEQISHAAALICAGWCTVPSDSPYWDRENDQYSSRSSTNEPERVLSEMRQSTDSTPPL